MNNIIIISSIISTLAIIISAVSWLLLKVNDIPHLKEDINDIKNRLKEIENKIYLCCIDIEKIKVIIKNDKQNISK
ncbi:MAG: hypothetical protein NZ839_02865 [Endomicrobia bacterium]|nr:hypothetical protein [Endomicrobiia bacterium]